MYKLHHVTEATNKTSVTKFPGNGYVEIIYRHIKLYSFV